MCFRRILWHKFEQSWPASAWAHRCTKQSRLWCQTTGSVRSSFLKLRKWSTRASTTLQGKGVVHRRLFHRQAQSGGKHFTTACRRYSFTPPISSGEQVQLEHATCGISDRHSQCTSG